MGPPLRSFAADAYDCIMVRVLGPTEYKVVARLSRARKRPSCSKLSRYGLASSEHAARLARRPTLTAPARDDVSEPRVGTKKRALRSNKETDERQKICRSANSLTKNAPYKESREVWQGGASDAILRPWCLSAGTTFTIWHELCEWVEKGRSWSGRLWRKADAR